MVSNFLSRYLVGKPPMQHPYLRDGPCVQVDEGAGLGVEGFVIIMRMFVFFYVLFLFSFHVCFIQSAHLGPSVVPFIVSIGFWASCGKKKDRSGIISCQFVRFSQVVSWFPLFL